MKIFLLLLLFFSSSAIATKITYHKGKAKFVAEHDGKTFSYSSGTLKHVFIIDDCNRNMLEQVWTRALRNAEKYPRAAGLPDEKGGYLQVDNEYRSIVPFGKDRLAKFEREIRTLRTQEKKKCKR